METPSTAMIENLSDPTKVWLYCGLCNVPAMTFQDAAYHFAEEHDGKKFLFISHALDDLQFRNHMHVSQDSERVHE